MSKCSYCQDEAHDKLCTVCTEHGCCEKHCQCESVKVMEDQFKDIRDRYEALCGRYLLYPVFQLHMDIGELLRQVDVRDKKLRKLVVDLHHKGNVAWTEDKPSVTEAYNISADGLEKLL